MAEYDLDFAAKLADIADQVDEQDPWAHDARRVTIYLSRLSVEISLKALLENVGVPIKKIKSRSHNLRALLNDVGRCEVLAEVTKGEKSWVPASRVRAITLNLDFVEVTVGTLIDAEDQGASQYPNQIRYGNKVIDFEPSFVSEMAILLAIWARENFDDIRLPQRRHR